MSQINLNSQYARITESIKLKNTGEAPLDRAILCAPDAALLAYQEVGPGAGSPCPWVAEGAAHWRPCGVAGHAWMPCADWPALVVAATGRAVGDLHSVLT